MCELRVKEILAQKGMTQRSMASRMGITEIALSRILKRGKPDFDTLVKMATALETPVSALFSDFLVAEIVFTCPYCRRPLNIEIKPVTDEAP